MGNKAKNSPFNACVMAMCSFVGVGFITGAEIWFYFARFGLSMIAGLVVFAVLMVFLVCFSFHDDKLQTKKFCGLKRGVFAVSELLIASAMISGLLETSKTLFGKAWFFVFLCAIFVICFMFFKSIKCFVFYNYFVAIFVLFVVVYLLLNNNYKNICNVANIGYKNITISMLFSCIYVFMNISEIRPILINLKTLETRKKIIIFACIFSLTLILLIIAFSVTLFCNPELSKFSMPFLLLFKNNGGVIYYVFIAGLVLAMISTAEACLMGVVNRINIDKNDENFARIIVIIISLIFGQIPFTFFVKGVYPFIAILNLFVFLLDCFSLRSKRQKIESRNDREN